MSEILELFGTSGTILKVNYIWRSDLNNLAECIIIYQKPESKEKAIKELNGIKIDELEIKVVDLK